MKEPKTSPSAATDKFPGRSLLSAHEVVFPSLPNGKLNEAQLIFLTLMSHVEDPRELDQLRRAVAKVFMQQTRDANQGLGKELGVNTIKGAAAFAKKTHHRTPYK